MNEKPIIQGLMIRQFLENEAFLFMSKRWFTHKQILLRNIF